MYPDFQLLFESAPGLMLVLRPDLVIVAVTTSYTKATLTKRSEILGRGIFDVFPDDPNDPAATGVQNLRDSLSRVLRDHAPDAMAVQKYSVKAEGNDAPFEERYWSCFNLPIFGPDGAIAYILHRAEDVTEFVRLKQHDAEQFELARTFELRTRQMEADVFFRAQELQQANKRLREVHEELEQRVRERTADLAAANEALKQEFAQSRQLELQLRQSQKMEAVGTLAGGVAHDFNNLLTVISGYSELLLQGDTLAEFERGLVEQIQGASIRAATLTKQLLLLSRHKVVELVVLDLNVVVSNTQRMLERLIGEDILVRTKLSPDLGYIRADQGQVEQVLVNLAVNARDAMPEGGTLSIETTNVELDETYSKGHFEAQPGNYAMLAVTDTGHGMDAETRARVFEPFFTTKPSGKGTGLGLSIVFGIVKQCGGTIWVYSEPGEGTTFKVYFPIVAGEGPRPTAVQTARPRGSETILLVEDESAVRAFAKVALESLGYTVLDAPDGFQAIEVCRQHPGPIHLLVSDVVMPRMGGRKAADAILEVRPDIKVLFLSGYTDDTVVRHGVLHEQAGFLQKPYTLSALASKVRTILDSNQQRS